MTKLATRLAAGAALLALSTLPCAAQNMKPGLWEMNSKMQSASGNLETMMGALASMQARMSPEQRAKVEAMMDQRGVKLSGSADGGVLVKMCLTPAMVAKNQLPLQQHGDCTSVHAPVTGNTMKVSFTCTRPVSSGEGQVTFQGDSAYRLNMKIVTNATGAEETMNVDGNGRWLGAECGAIRPPQG